VHRLDKPVTGVLLFARSPAAATRLQNKIMVRPCQTGSGGLPDRMANSVQL